MNFGNFNNIVNFGNNFSTTFGDFSDDIINGISQFNNIININGNNDFDDLRAIWWKSPYLELTLLR